MNDPAQRPLAASPAALASDGLDLCPRILEYVLLHWDEGPKVHRAEVLDQFPGQERQVDAVLAAVSSYTSRLHKDGGGSSGESASALLHPGDTLGEFTVEAMIGQGGMGQVYRARQESLEGRIVALKVLPPALVATDQRFVDRFRREASCAAGVQHAGLAQIYGSGGERGLLFFAMALVEGWSLRKVIADRSANRAQSLQPAEGWDPARVHVRQSVRVAQRVAAAMGALHVKGLVHRDIKPANIILEGAGSTGSPLECPPLLIDFGLLRPVGTSTLTGHMTRIGTPAFASPESQLGRDIDARADVFSLAAVLHDLLTLTPGGGRPPASAGLGNLRSLNPAVDARLAAIVEMALEERPASRYADGQAFGEELEAYLSDGAIQALPTTHLGRLRRRVTRNPARALRHVGWAFLVMLPITLVLSWVGAYVVPLYESAAQGRRLQAAGHLERASLAFRGVTAQPTLTNWLPGLGDAYSRGQSYWTQDLAFSLPPMGVILTGFDNAQGGSLQAIHEHMRVYLTSSSQSHWRTPLLQCLRSQIQIDMPLARRELAMETLAVYYGLTHLREDAQEPEESVRLALEDDLVAILTASAAPEASKGLISSAAAALSGMPNQRVFEVLSEWLAGFDPSEMQVDTCRSVLFCLERIWWSLHDADRLDELTLENLGKWVEGGVGLMASAIKESRFLPECVNSIIALTAMTCRERRLPGSGSVPRFGGLGDEALAHLNAWSRLIAMASGDASQNDSQGPIHPAYTGPESSKTFGPEQSRIERVTWIKNWYSRSKSPFSTYLDIWSPPMPLSKGHGKASAPTKSTGDSAFVSKTRFELSNDKKEVVALGENVDFQWSGVSLVAEGTNMFFQFEAIGADGLALTAPIPPASLGLPHCRITLAHERAARWYMPSAGRARIRITLGEQIFELDAPRDKYSLIFLSSKSAHAGKETITLSIELIGGTTTYRLHDVRFEWVASSYD